MYCTTNQNQIAEELKTARKTISIKSASLNCMTKEAPLWKKQAAMDAINAAEATIRMYAPQS